MGYMDWCRWRFSVKDKGFCLKNAIDFPNINEVSDMGIMRI